MKTIALLTDFGLVDNFVGVMKGVILNINPRIKIVDISHQIFSQDITQAAFLLKSSYRYFPRKTIFLVVVDPGVGSKRRPIIIRTKNYFFVGPDNGCLSLAACADGIEKTAVIENRKYFLKPLSDTFHGRDIFAPAAAYLAEGKALSSFGKTLSSINRLNIAPVRINKNCLKGEIVYTDRFGNLVTNISRDIFKRFTKKKRFKIKIKDIAVDALAKSYQDVRRGEALAIFGSFGFLEISINQGSAERSLALGKGAGVELRTQS